MMEWEDMNNEGDHGEGMRFTCRNILSVSATTRNGGWGEQLWVYGGLNESGSANALWACVCD